MEPGADDGPRAADHGGRRRRLRTAPTVPATLEHCWVSDVHGRLPALLLEWRRTGTGFQGRVVRPVYDEAEGWLIVEEWLDSSLLSPI